MAAVGLAADLRGLLVIGALIALAIALAACGGGGETPLLQAPTGEVRATVRVDNRANVVVALEARDSEGLWGATTHPNDATVQEREDGDDWWRSSAVTVDVRQPATVRIEDDTFIIEPPIAGYTDDCATLFIGPGEDQGTLAVSPITGALCDRWAAPLNFAPPAESVRLTVQIAAHWKGDCVNLQIEIQRASNDWRAMPASRLCGLEERRRAAAADGEGFVSQSAAPVSLPVSRVNAIELRVGGIYGLSAAIGGRILPTDCGIHLHHGFLSVWQHRYEGQACEWSYLSRILTIEDGPAPDDHLDQQQYHVYDWERDVVANLLTAEWRRPISLAQAQKIVTSIYNDFLDTTAQPPTLAAAHADAEFTGLYDTAKHQIQLRPDGLLPFVVLHETAHAMLRLTLPGEAGYYLEPRHGAEFAAHLISLWSRYADDFDTEAAAAFADDYGVHIFPAPPIQPVGNAATRETVREAIAGP